MIDDGWFGVVPPGIWFGIGVLLGGYLRDIRNRLDRMETKVDRLEQADDE